MTYRDQQVANFEKYIQEFNKKTNLDFYTLSELSLVDFSACCNKYGTYVLRFVDSMNTLQFIAKFATNELFYSYDINDIKEINKEIKKYLKNINTYKN